MRERFLSHCAINQLNFWLHRKSHKAAIQIHYKANNPSWEESTAQYVSLILSLIDLITSEVGWLWEDRIKSYTAKTDEVGLRAFLELLLLLINPILENSVCGGISLTSDKVIERLYKEEIESIRSFFMRSKQIYAVVLYC